jgi:hypothetical protein
MRETDGAMPPRSGLLAPAAVRARARLRREAAGCSACLPVAIVTVALAGCALLQPGPYIAPALPPAQSPERHVFRLVWPIDGAGNAAIVGTRSEGRIVAALEPGIGIVFHFVAIEPGVHALGIAVANHTHDAVVIPWHLASLTGPDLMPHHIINGGDARVERAGATLPTRVPVGGVLEDYVFPTQFVTDSSDGLGGRRYSPFFERIRDGQTVMLILPMRMGGQITSHTFRFLASVESSS